MIRSSSFRQSGVVAARLLFVPLVIGGFGSAGCGDVSLGAVDEANNAGRAGEAVGPTGLRAGTGGSAATGGQATGSGGSAGEGGTAGAPLVAGAGGRGGAAGEGGHSGVAGSSGHAGAGGGGSDPGPLCPELGDVNRDGAIDVADALLIAQHVDPDTEPAAPFYVQVADVNCDGSVDAADPQLVSEYYTGLITEFPCTEPPAPALGDVNWDGAVDSADALLIAQHADPDTPPPVAPFCVAVADVDCNGLVQTEDAELVSLYYVGSITEFPCVEP